MFNLFLGVLIFFIFLTLLERVSPTSEFEMIKSWEILLKKLDFCFSQKRDRKERESERE
jgi:hypothetical protein